MGTWPAVVNATAGPTRPMSETPTSKAPTSEAHTSKAQTSAATTHPAAPGQRMLLLGEGLAVVTGVILRLWPRPALWLDEAQSVAFARESFGSIPGALRQDGAPPLYYLLLRAWTNAFGTGTTAVRLLSAVLSVGALVVLTAVAKQLWNARAAAAVLVIASTSSFAIRYASETRMYSLVTLEVAAGMWFAVRWIDRRSFVALAGLAATAAALLYTHYWGLYLVATVLIVLAIAAIRPVRRPVVVPIGVAIVAGCALWLPWLPSFRFQSRHTATPWAQAARLGDIVTATGLRTGWGSLARSIVVVVLSGAVIGAVVQTWARARTNAPERPRLLRALLFVTVACPLLAVAGGALSNSAYTVRYTAVVFPPAMLVAGAACALIRPARLGAAAVVVVAVLSAAVSIHEIGVPRTTASRIAALMRPLVRPGDVVVYCPDQLGPAMHRQLAGDPAFANVRQEVYPAGDPSRVDWIDYRARYDRADPIAATATGAVMAATNRVWLVWSGTYPPTQAACTALFNQLQRTHPDHRVLAVDDPSISDHESLWEFEPAA